MQVNQLASKHAKVIFYHCIVQAVASASYSLLSIFRVECLLILPMLTLSTLVGTSK